MYTKRFDINKMAEEYLDGKTFVEIIFNVKDSKENKNEILEEVIKSSKEQNARLIDENYLSLTYDMLFKAIKIYRRKCYDLAGVLRNLSSDDVVCEDFVKYFDIKLDGDNVLTRDVKRLLIPLKKNLELLDETINQIKNVETYCRVDERLMKGKKLPRASLFRSSTNNSDEYVALTHGVVERIVERREKAAKKILEETLNKD